MNRPAEPPATPRKDAVLGMLYGSKTKSLNKRKAKTSTNNTHTDTNPTDTKCPQDTKPTGPAPGTNSGSQTRHHLKTWAFNSLARQECPFLEEISIGEPPNGQQVVLSPDLDILVRANRLERRDSPTFVLNDVLFCVNYFSTRGEVSFSPKTPHEPSAQSPFRSRLLSLANSRQRRRVGVLWNARSPCSTCSFSAGDKTGFEAQNKPETRQKP